MNNDIDIYNSEPSINEMPPPIRLSRVWVSYLYVLSQKFVLFSFHWKGYRMVKSETLQDLPLKSETLT